ncbi:MAG: hypothetical protein AAGC57_04025 [Pseudomonadota bacterium]
MPRTSFLKTQRVPFLLVAAAALSAPNALAEDSYDCRLQTGGQADFVIDGPICTFGKSSGIFEGGETCVVSEGRNLRITLDPDTLRVSYVDLDKGTEAKGRCRARH